MANIIPALVNDTLGTTSSPWKGITAKKVELIPNQQFTSVENSLYIQNGILYFNGSPVGSGVVSSSTWKAYELQIEQEAQSICEIWVASASITYPDNTTYPAQARVLYNGIEIAPSNLTFEVGSYGDLFPAPPGSISNVDPSEEGTKITINIPDEDGQSFTFEIGASILVWNNE